MEPATPATRLFREFDAALDSLSLDELLRSLTAVGATPLPAARRGGATPAGAPTTAARRRPHQPLPAIDEARVAEATPSSSTASSWAAANAARMGAAAEASPDLASPFAALRTPDVLAAAAALLRGSRSGGAGAPLTPVSSNLATIVLASSPKARPAGVHAPPSSPPPQRAAAAVAAATSSSAAGPKVALNDGGADAGDAGGAPASASASAPATSAATGTPLRLRHPPPRVDLGEPSLHSVTRKVRGLLHDADRHMEALNRRSGSGSCGSEQPAQVGVGQAQAHEQPPTSGATAASARAGAVAASLPAAAAAAPPALPPLPPAVVVAASPTGASEHRLASDVASLAGALTSQAIALHEAAAAGAAGGGGATAPAAAAVRALASAATKLGALSSALHQLASSRQAEATTAASRLATARADAAAEAAATWRAREDTMQGQLRAGTARVAELEAALGRLAAAAAAADSARPPEPVARASAPQPVTTSAATLLSEESISSSSGSSDGGGGDHRMALAISEARVRALEAALAASVAGRDAAAATARRLSPGAGLLGEVAASPGARRDLGSSGGGLFAAALAPLDAATSVAVALGSSGATVDAAAADAAMAADGLLMNATVLEPLAALQPTAAALELAGACAAEEASVGAELWGAEPAAASAAAAVGAPPVFAPQQAVAPTPVPPAPAVARAWVLAAEAEAARLQQALDSRGAELAELRARLSAAQQALATMRREAAATAVESKRLRAAAAADSAALSRDLAAARDECSGLQRALRLVEGAHEAALGAAIEQARAHAGEDARVECRLESARGVRAAAAAAARGHESEIAAAVEAAEAALIADADARLAEERSAWEADAEAALAALAAQRDGETAAAVEAARSHERQLAEKRVDAAQADVRDCAALVAAETARRRALQARLHALQGPVHVHARIRPTLAQLASGAAGGGGGDGGDTLATMLLLSATEDAATSGAARRGSVAPSLDSTSLQRALAAMRRATGSAPPARASGHSAPASASTSASSSEGAFGTHLSLSAASASLTPTTTSINRVHASTRSAGGGSSYDVAPQPPARVLAQGNGQVVLQNHGAAHEFALDEVHGPGASQAGVFEAAVRPLLDAALSDAGAHACIFVCGGPGSGKTHTFEGTRAQPGLVLRAVLYALEQQQQQCGGAPHGLHISVMEVATEGVFDLLGGMTDSEQPLLDATGASGAGGPAGAGAHHAGAASAAPSEAAALAAAVTTYRSTSRIGATGGSDAAWARQLRSPGDVAAASPAVGPQPLHVREGGDGELAALTRLRLTSISQALTALVGAAECARRRASAAGGGAGGGHVVVRLCCPAQQQQLQLQGATVSLVDVAARDSATGSALASVLAALRRRALHVPYRDAQLTRVLRGALGAPRARALLLACVAPSEGDEAVLGESLRTLQQAARVRGA